MNWPIQESDRFNLMQKNSQEDKTKVNNEINEASLFEVKENLNL